MNDKKLRVDLVSESEFTVQGHGVHTAFVEMRNQLEKRQDVILSVNAKPTERFDITHIHTMGPFSLRRLLSRNGGKKVITAHVIPDSFIGSLVGAKYWAPLAGYYLKWFYNRADIILAVSEYTKKGLIGIGVKKPIHILPNSIDTSKYKISTTEKRALRKKLGFHNDDFIVVGNGQIQPRKKFDTFVSIAESLPDIHFIWIGGIPFKEAGADFAHLNRLMKNPPQNLRITDVVSLKEAGDYMRAADMMFMPSIEETFGLAIVEGAASNLPVLVRDIHDYDATFADLVLRGQDDSFRELILKIRDDPIFAKTWRQNSKKLAQKYDSKGITDQLVKVYREILA